MFALGQLSNHVSLGRGLSYSVGAMLVACLVLGGATRPGFLSDVIIQLLAVPLLLAGLWRYFDLPAAQRPRSAMVLIIAVVFLPFLQLVPLPPEVWTALPGREPEVTSLRMLDGSLPWMPISVAPAATWLSAISLLPPLAIFLGTSLLGFRDRRMLSLLVLAVGVFSVFLGLTQVAQGPSSQLRFFSHTNLSEAVGFFANRNHFAAMLYALTLFAAAWAVDRTLMAAVGPERNRFQSSTVITILAGFTVLVALVAGQAMARSRAGLGLTIVALLGAFGLAFTDRRAASGVTTTRLMVGGVTLAVIFVMQFALYRILERFTFDPLADARIPFARNTIEAAKAHMPFGSGIGTFVPVYAGFEKPADTLANIYANHAHNDVLELWLEGGVLGIALIVLGVLWVASRTISVWRSGVFGTQKIDLILARAASLVVALLIAHSFVDYPLRTAAMMAILAFSCALLIAPPALVVEEEPERDEARRSPRSSPKRALAEVGPAKWTASAITPPPPSPGTASQSGERWGPHVNWPTEWRKPQGGDPPSPIKKPKFPGEAGD